MSFGTWLCPRTMSSSLSLTRGLRAQEKERKSKEPSQKFALRELSEVGISSAPGGAALSDSSASADTKMILVIQYTLHDKGKPVVRRGRKATDLY
jgi:hypothetical protein